MKDLNPPDYDFVWTVDGGGWDGRFFDSLDELHDFAGDLVSANEENPAFKFYGRRFEVMDACDMLHHKRHRWWQPYCRRVFIALPIEESNSMHIIGPYTAATT